MDIKEKYRFLSEVVIYMRYHPLKLSDMRSLIAKRVGFRIINYN
jgi:hypothetical protein